MICESSVVLPAAGPVGWEAEANAAELESGKWAMVSVKERARTCCEKSCCRSLHLAPCKSFLVQRSEPHAETLRIVDGRHIHVVTRNIDGYALLQRVEALTGESIADVRVLRAHQGDVKPAQRLKRGLR